MGELLVSDKLLEGNKNQNKCDFCFSKKLKLTYANRFHPYQKNHGPFNYFTCHDCGALAASPKPTIESLVELYSNMIDGLPKELRDARNLYPQDHVYTSYLNTLKKEVRSSIFKLLDIGSGGGEFVSLVRKNFPESNITCVDFHGMPKSLSGSRIQWEAKDLNASIDLNQKFDVITSFAVFEHMLYPEVFFENLRRHSHSQTKIILIFPRQDSILSKILKDRWPYFIPGEHISLATGEAMRHLISRHFKFFEIRSTYSPYSLKYLLHYLKLKKLCALLPFDINIPVPAGLFLIKIKVD